MDNDDESTDEARAEWEGMGQSAFTPEPPEPSLAKRIAQRVKRFAHDVWSTLSLRFVHRQR